jgi:hypothetical protein
VGVGEGGKREREREADAVIGGPWRNSRSADLALIATLQLLYHVRVAHKYSSTH